MPQRSYAHAAALGAIAAVCLAGCSAGADVDPERFEVAIRSHAVANLAPYGTVTDVDCRPADPAVLQRHSDRFPQIALFPITLVAKDWQDAGIKFFAENGVFDVIYKPKSKP